MSKFEGKWVDDTTKPKEGFEALMEKMGMGDKVESQKAGVSRIRVKVEGDKWTVHYSNSEVNGGKEKETIFTIGQEFENTGFDGMPYKATIQKISDTELHQTGKTEKYEFVLTRKIIEGTERGDVMEVAVTVDGATMTSQMIRED